MLLRMSIAAAAISAAATTAHGAIVGGHCYLEGQTNHCLTKVEIDDSVLHLPLYTDSSGEYCCWYAVAPLAWHTFSCSHVGYYPKSQQWYVPIGGGSPPDMTLQTRALCDPETWQYYPFSPPGTDITFPYDDGKHNPTAIYRAEWWYVNFHLTDEDGVDYGGFAAFFKPPVIGLPSMVLFSIIDLETGIMYSAAKIQELFTAHDQYLDVAAGLPPCDRFYNKQCEGDLLPFEYHLYVSGVDNGVVWYDLDMKSLKPPMPVGEDGFVEFTEDIWTYYYSDTRVDMLGRIHLPGFPALGKEVTGYGWIDHQWANFPPDTVTWEWLSIQLDDDRDIMVADVWVDEEPLGSFAGGLNYYDEQCAREILEPYCMTPLASWTDDVTGREFDHQIMRIGENQIFPLCFWEGACTVTGTIEGQAVAGTAYAEVTHSPPNLCRADFDEDGDVDTADLLHLLSCWGTSCGDVDGDCNTDTADLLALLAAWGSCP